jgi:acyl-CoA thioesterase-1
VILVLLCLGIIGCEQASEPRSSPTPPPSVASAPSDGLGQRFGTDVTAQPGRRKAPARHERPVIAAFGDSLTAGLGVSAEEAYPAQLQRRLDQSGYRYRVLNAGVSGDTTAGAVRRVDWVLKSKPDIVIVEFGGNDGLRGLDLAETRRNLDQVIERLKAADVTVVLAGMKLPPNYGEEYTTRFVELYPELARKHGVPLIPFFLEGVAAKTSLNQADGIHPTGEGYRVIVENLVTTLKPLLVKPSPTRS